MNYQFINKDISHALYNSLNHEPFYKVLEQSICSNPVECKEGMLKYFDFSMKEAEAYGELFIPVNKNYGASLWSKPLDETLSKQVSNEKKAFFRQQLGDSCLSKYSEIVEFMSQNIKDVIPINSWYLSILGIEPQFQGQGLGITLVKPILDRIDAAGLPSYLETFNPRNKNFYKKLGYLDAASFLEPITDSEYWIMFREPLAERVSSK